jgi:hypothetical protein
MSEREKDRRNYNVTPEQFIEAWQTSDGVAGVAKKLKMPKDIINSRASNYRSAGIRLKKMSRRPKNRLDVEACNRLVEELDRQRGQDE